MPPKKPATRRIEIEPEQPEPITMNIEPKEETLRDVADVGRPAGKKDDKPRKMTMARMEALQKAQAKRRENLEKKRAAETKVKEIIEPKPLQEDNESYEEVITNIKDKPKSKESESVETHKSSVISKPKQKKKIIIVKEEESESDESIEVKYIKPKTKPKQRQRENTYDYEPAQEREPNALELLLKHYGGF
jgi:predicted Zn-dependent protease